MTDINQGLALPHDCNLCVVSEGRPLNRIEQMIVRVELGCEGYVLDSLPQARLSVLTSLGTIIESIRIHEGRPSKWVSMFSSYPTAPKTYLTGLRPHIEPEEHYAKLTWLEDYISAFTTMNIVPWPHNRMREVIELLWDGKKISMEHIYRIENHKDVILRNGASNDYRHKEWGMLRTTTIIQ